VHGLSEAIDPRPFEWTDGRWRGLALADAVIYELHVGAFTATGTFAGVRERLDYLQHLGVTAIEIMPVAEFAGRWNWGYDGVDLFAPSHNYGRPEELRRLVNAAHDCGLAVILDVVYNHLGPDGAYLSAFSPYYFTDERKTAWGCAVNLNGPHHERVREFFLQNALHWIHEYHMDGLRLDATHALHDDEAEPFLAELARAVHGATSRHTLVIAEDERNLAALACPTTQGGQGLDALWADDFHHHVRRFVARDRDGYFRSYSGTTADIARTIERGWFYCGQVAEHTGQPRGTDPQPLGLDQFVFCLQNHDQIGNRAFGERLHTQIPANVYRAVTALLLCAPETPMLFMGQEWGASRPFRFFTDHEQPLGAAVTDGRRAEFAAFSEFRDPESRASIPDPQDEQTFRSSQLCWAETTSGEHCRLLRLHRALLALRRTDAAMRTRERRQLRVEALDEASIAMWREADDGDAILLVARLAGAGSVSVRVDAPAAWSTVLTTEDAAFSSTESCPDIQPTQDGLTLSFPSPAAVVLRRGRDRVRSPAGS
jgi:maltooligosyltrehalose trehalohydrolase